MTDELLLLGKRIAKLRTSKHLTQEKLAEMVDRTPNHISKLELAATNPSFEVLVKIAHALSVDLSALFAVEEIKNSQKIKKELMNLINSADDDEIKLLYKLYCAIKQ